MGDDTKARLLWFAIGLVAVYAAVIWAAVTAIGLDQLMTDEGFYRFCVAALAASPLALARVARGRLLLAAVAAGCAITVLLRLARGEASSVGLAFAVVFLAVLLVVELGVSRWERRAAGER
jgi:hypothetical protein